MGKIELFCLFCWILGGAFMLSAIRNGRLSHIRYLSDTNLGTLFSRVLTGGFGAVLFGVGALVWMAPGR